MVALAASLVQTHAATARTRASLANWKASVEAEYHLAETWQMKDGLPSDRIRAVLQTRDGYIWIGTPEGLVRFDGVRFRVYNRANSTGLENNFIHRIFEDQNGRLWLTHDNGEISFYEAGRFNTLPLESSWKGLPIVRILESPGGKVWFLNALGQIRTSSDGQIRSILRRDERLRGAAIDSDGRIWACTANRLFEVNDAQSSPQAEREVPDLAFPAIFPASEGGIWVASKGTVKRWHHGEWTDDNLTIGSGTDTVVAEGQELKSGSILISTRSSGLLILSKNGGHQAIVGEAMIPTGSVDSLCEDREGNIWIGTGVHGLGIVRPKRVSMLDLPGNERLPRILSLHAGINGELWIGSEGSGLYRLREDQITRFPTHTGATNYLVSAIAEDDKGRILFAQAGSAVHRIGTGGFENFADISEIMPVHALMPDSDGKSFWIGGRSVARLREGQPLQRLPLPDDDQPKNVRCFAKTADGVLWIGTRDDGLLRSDGRTVARYSVEHGLPSSQVWALHTTEEGTVWVATYGGGLTRIKNDQVSNLPAGVGLPTVICHILDDKAGNFWLSSNVGIVRVSRVDLERCADGLASYVPSLVLDNNDGLRSLDMVGGEHSAGCRTIDGRLWFATARGVAMVDPRRVQALDLDPIVRIEDIKVNGRSFKSLAHQRPHSEAQEPIEIPAGSHAIDIEYAGLSYSAPNRVQFRYRFEGRDIEWTVADDRRTAYFWNLPPGEYAFRVMARNGTSDWRNESAITFRVMPFFWQTTWFMVVALTCAAGVIGGVAIGVSQRSHRKRLAILERQRAVERDRTRIAHDLHDEIGAGLTQLTLLAHSNDNESLSAEKALPRFDEIRTSIQRMTEALDEIVWAVNPQNDSIDSLVTYLGRFSQEFLNRARISCKLDFPFDLDHLEVSAEARHAVYLALREALHNVIRHSGATEVHISLQREGANMIILVRDNGRGFPHTVPGFEESRNARASSNDDGLGLQSMRQRLESIGGAFSHGNSPEGGAFVAFRLPAIGSSN